jgi:TPR repeat protein
LARAARYFEAAAGQSKSLAQVRCEKHLELGIGHAPNPDPAVEFYQNGSSLADADALDQLERYLEFGQCLPKDLPRARDRDRAAGFDGSVNAQFNYGFCLHDGLGDEPNVPE